MGAAEYLNYLDLYELFINKIAGSPLVFLALFFLVIAILAARFRSPNMVTFSLFITGALFLSPFFTEALVISLLGVGMFFAWSLAKFIGKK